MDISMDIHIHGKPSFWYNDKYENVDSVRPGQIVGCRETTQATILFKWILNGCQI